MRRVVVNSGAMRKLTVHVERDDRNLFVLSVDSCTKYPMVTCASCADGKRRWFEVAMMASDNTLRADKRFKRPTTIEIHGLGDGWLVECPDSCRYSFHVVAWRTAKRARMVWPVGPVAGQ